MIDNTTTQKDRIISISRRTDVLAAYYPWLKRRIEEGFCIVRNPFNPSQERTVSLKPEHVDCLVFWTRNPAGLLNDGVFFDYLKSRYNFYFLFTITGYPREIEPRVPSRDEAVELFRRLSGKCRPGAVVWRYDPIFITGEMDYDYHRENFSRLARDLQGFTSRVIVSLFDPYKKALTRLKKAGIKFKTREEVFNNPGLARMLTSLKDFSGEFGMEIQGCCENFQPFGIPGGGCIDGELINRLFGMGLGNKPDKCQREQCLCTGSVDVGSYNTCPHGCLYCYAFGKPETALQKRLSHDPRRACL